MLKKTITYTNLFTDEEVTEDHYFHLSEADFVEILAGINSKFGDDVEGYLTHIQLVENRVEMIEFFKQLILKSYLKRVDNKPVKNQQIREEFESSEAYSAFFMSLVGSEDPSEFIQGILPKGLSDEASVLLAKQQAAAAPTAVSEDLSGSTPSDPDPVPKILSHEEVVEMDRDELKSGLATGRYKLA